LVRRVKEKQYEQSLYWLNAAFDILVSLGLYGSAILLDNDIRPAYEALEDVAGLGTHRMRVMNAAQHLDPMREKVPFSRISPILRRYAQYIFSSSEQMATKQESLDQARHALGLEEPEIDSAIEILEKARSLIDRHNPVDEDVDILNHLLIGYYLRGGISKAREVDRLLSLVQSTIQGRDFLALAEHYKATGDDYLWALKIAAEASPENEYSIKAQAELGLERLKIEEEEPPLDEEVVEAVFDQSALLAVCRRGTFPRNGI
jgi:hypothetical protein